MARPNLATHSDTNARIYVNDAGNVEVQHADGSYFILTAIPLSYDIGSKLVQDGQWWLQFRECRISGQNRLAIAGVGEMVIADLGASNRLVLSGRGA